MHGLGVTASSQSGINVAKTVSYDTTYSSGGFSTLYARGEDRSDSYGYTVYGNYLEFKPSVDVSDISIE